MSEHEDRHRSQSDSQPRHVSDKVAAEEFLGAEKRANRGKNGKDYANDQRAALDGLYYWRSHQIEIVGARRGHLCSSFWFCDLGSIFGRVEPEPGSPRNSGGADGSGGP